MPKGLSRNQKRILEMLEIKPEMTTKEISEMPFGIIVKYKSKEFSSTYRSLKSLENRGYLKRVHVKLLWRKQDQRLRQSRENPS